jgi:hypothetical protein
LYRLDPFLGSDGLLRVGGRLCRCLVWRDNDRKEASRHIAEKWSRYRADYSPQTWERCPRRKRNHSQPFKRQILDHKRQFQSQKLHINKLVASTLLVLLTLLQNQWLKSPSRSHYRINELTLCGTRNMNSVCVY